MSELYCEDCGSPIIETPCPECGCRRQPVTEPPMIPNKYSPKSACGAAISKPNTIRVVRTNVNPHYFKKHIVSFDVADTVLLNLDEWSVNPCEKCVAECKGKVGHVTDGTYCISRANYETEQSIINKLKEATK